jgi:predicted DNA-binding ribbon-helix-helix protein
VITVMVDTPARTSGRPRVYDPEDIRTDIKLPRALYSRLVKLANQRGISVQVLLRAAIIAHFRQ